MKKIKLSITFAMSIHPDALRAELHVRFIQNSVRSYILFSGHVKLTGYVV
jgi:hypothetical protein